jgi:phosphoglycolate phosphatase
VPILENLGLAPLFRGIHGTEDDGRFDDKAVLARWILATHGLTRAALAGDRLHDMEAAHANHIPAIGAGWGYGGREELERCGASVVLDHAMHLPGAVADLLA